MDPTAALTILGAGIGGKKMVEKLLGPTADYLGEGLRSWTEHRVTNVKRIFEAAAKILGEDINRPGTVPPKVLKEIMDEGSYNDDRLSCEYFGGVLASSRTQVSRDDRGAALMKLVSEMTTYQIRSHYIFYSATKKVFDGNELFLGDATVRLQCMVFISMNAYNSLMGVSPPEDLSAILPHATFGLHYNGLIGDFEYGGVEFLRKKSPHVKTGGVYVTPTARGAELYMWACGKGALPPIDFLKTTTTIPEQEEIRMTDGISSWKEASAPPAASSNSAGSVPPA